MIANASLVSVAKVLLSSASSPGEILWVLCPIVQLVRASAVWGWRVLVPLRTAKLVYMPTVSIHKQANRLIGTCQ